MKLCPTCGNMVDPDQPLDAAHSYALTCYFAGLREYREKHKNDPPPIAPAIPQWPDKVEHERDPRRV